MKEIIKYEDNNMVTWNTKREAIISDSRILLEKISLNGDKHYDDFDVGRFFNDIKKNDEAIDAVLNLLELDIDKLQARWIIEKTNNT